MPKVVHVQDIKKMKKGYYDDGDLIISKKKIGILFNEKVIPLEVDLKQYIKKTDLDKILKKEYPELFEKKEGK